MQSRFFQSLSKQDAATKAAKDELGRLKSKLPDMSPKWVATGLWILVCMCVCVFRECVVCIWRYIHKMIWAGWRASCRVRALWAPKCTPIIHTHVHMYLYTNSFMFIQPHTHFSCMQHVLFMHAWKVRALRHFFWQARFGINQHNSHRRKRSGQSYDIAPTDSQ